MADFPEPMLAGTLAITGTVSTILAQGVTFPPPAGTVNAGYKIASKAMTAYPLSHTFTVPELQKNVKTAFGYLPYGVTVLGFSVVSADLETGGPTLVQSIFLGDTEVVTGLVTGQAGTNGYFVCNPPTALTAPTVLYMKVTTAGAAGLAGAVTIHAHYYST